MENACVGVLSIIFLFVLGVVRKLPYVMRNEYCSIKLQLVFSWPAGSPFIWFLYAPNPRKFCSSRVLCFWL